GSIPASSANYIYWTNRINHISKPVDACLKTVLAACQYNPTTGCRSGQKLIYQHKFIINLCAIFARISNQPALK
ncbi:hypothetical protein, partial [Aeromonas sp.]|uniref:hypothetical protein n=1 Tax=Aeromonas sp. TaxID=647 RepID=UPI00258F5B3E